MFWFSLSRYPQGRTILEYLCFGFLCLDTLKDAQFWNIYVLVFLVQIPSRAHNFGIFMFWFSLSRYPQGRTILEYLCFGFPCLDTLKGAQFWNIYVLVFFVQIPSRTHNFGIFMFWFSLSRYPQGRTILEYLCFGFLCLDTLKGSQFWNIYVLVFLVQIPSRAHNFGVIYGLWLQCQIIFLLSVTIHS